MTNARRAWLFGACACLVAFGISASAHGQPYVLLGPSDNAALVQPRVAVELFDETGGPPVSLGPTDHNTFRLDFGATIILDVGSIEEQLGIGLSAISELETGGYVTEGTHEEQGIAGGTIFDVSAAYRVDFAGTNGVRQTLPQTATDVRILSNKDILFGGFHGIIGMPGVADRITMLDFIGWSGG